MTAHPPLEQRHAAELMTRDLLTIAASESVLMAWELMCKAGVHHLPVTDDEGGFVGVLDAQTITTTWSAAAPQEARRPVTSLLPSRPPPAVGPSSTVREAARAMLESGGDHVAVTDEHGVLVGLITAARPDRRPRRRRARQGAAQRRHAVPLPHRTGAAPHHPGTRGPHRTATRLTGRHFWTRRPVSRTFARPCENAAHERAAAEPACRRRGAGRARAAVPEAEPPRPPPGRRVSRATAGAPPHASRRPFPRGSRFMAGHRDDHPPGAAGSPMTADHGGHGGHAQHDGHDGHGGHGGHGDHEEQFRRLFWVMLVLAVPVVVFSGMFA